MALAVRASVVGGTTTGSSTTIAMTIPTSGAGGTVVAGDVGICCFETAGSNTVSSAPSGWTQRKITTNAQANITGCIYTKTLTAGDINTPLTWTVSSSVNITGSIDVISGADESSFVYTAWTVGTGTTVANTTVVVPANGWDFGFWMGGITTNGAAFTCTKPASYTLASTRATSITSGLNHAQATGFLSVPAGGSTAGSTCTFSVSTARNAAYAIGIAPTTNVTVAGDVAAITTAAPAGAIFVGQLVSAGPAYRAGAKGNDGQVSNSATCAVTVPVTAVPGDTALAVLVTSTAGATITGAPSGWTLASGPDAASSTTITSWLYTKTLVSGDIGAAATWTVSASARFIAAMDVFAGAAAVGTPVWRNQTGTQTSLTDAAVTSAFPRDFVYEAWITRSGSATANVVTLPTSPAYTADTITVTNGATSNYTITTGHFSTADTGSYGGNAGTVAPAASPATYYAVEVQSESLAVTRLSAFAGTVTAATALGGATAAVTVAALAGAVRSDVRVAGAVASVSTAALAGVPATAIPGAVASAALASPAGSVVARVAGAVAAQTTAAPAGSVAAAVAGQTVSVTTAALAGSIHEDAHIAGAVASITTAAQAGSIAAATSGTTATATLAAPAGSVAVAVTGQTSAVTVAAPAGSVASGTFTTVTGATAAAAFAASAGSIADTVAGQTAHLNLAAPTPTATATVAGQTAAATVEALPGVIVEEVGAFVPGETAELTAAAQAGTVNAATAAPTAHATASALPGSIRVTIAAPVATATISAVPVAVAVALGAPTAAVTVTALPGSIPAHILIAAETARLTLAALPGSTIQPRRISATAGQATTAWAASGPGPSTFATGDPAGDIATGTATTRFTTGTPTAEWATGDPA